MCDFIIVILWRGERVIDLLNNAENEPDTEDDTLLCADPDEDDETLEEKEGNSDTYELDDWLELPDGDTDSSTDWEIDIWLDRDCFGDREDDGVEVCVFDVNDDGDIDLDFTLVFVIAIEAVMVFEITMEDDFFEVTDEDGETLADDETEGDIVDDSETDEEKVTSSDGLTLTAALVEGDVL